MTKNKKNQYLIYGFVAFFTVSAQGSFTCVKTGNRELSLVSLHNVLAPELTAEECWRAVTNSQNGFTCVPMSQYRKMALVSIHKTIALDLTRDDCWIAVRNSKSE